MRQALPESGQNRARPKTLPAPTGGWNTGESVVTMKPNEAIFLDNWFPRTSDVMLRKGYSDFASTPAATRVRGLLGYKSPSGSAKVFAAAQNGIYEVTAGGAIAAVSTVVTNAECQSVNITTAGGSFLWVCNGVDKARYFDGAAWTILDGASAPALTGVTSTDIANVSQHGKRLIFCVKNKLSFYYLPIDSIAGAAVEFPLGALCRKGGYLMATASWTIDGGNGPDNYFVAITSEGELVAYRGTDPSSATAFGLIGVYDLGVPMSRRCFVDVGGDMAVMTRGALIPLSKLAAVKGDLRVALTDKIDRVYNDFANNTDYNSLFGWQVLTFPEAQMLIINVPILDYPARDVMYSYQFVMNTMTNAWCRFLSLNSEVWLAFNGKLYFALKNHIYQAWEADSDNGKDIKAKAKTAFSALGSGGIKQVTLARPIFNTNGSVTSQLSFDVDYENSTSRGSYSTFSQQLAIWDSAIWNTARWSSNNSTIKDWRTAACKPGSVAATRLQVSAKDVTLTWTATDLRIVDGGLM
jgi:hypothetical protein